MAWGRRQHRLRALVLSAGFGQRLRPLTQQIPKPLLPVLGKSSVVRTLQGLARLGCESAFLNLHFLGEQVREAVGTDVDGMEIRYSEEEEILGTLGALGPIARQLADSDAALLINSDSLCRWPLSKMVKEHLRHDAIATLLIAERAPFRGNVAVSKDGRLLQLRHDRRLPSDGVASSELVFGGAQVLSPRLLDRVAGRSEPADIVGELYEPLLDDRENLRAVRTKRPWHDLGTPWRYLQALVQTAGRASPLRSSWISDRATLGARSKIRRAVIEHEVVLEEDCRVETSAVLPGARLEAGCRLKDSLVAPGVVLPAGTGLDRRLVTPLSSGRDPAGRDSVVGQLVYTPIEVPQGATP
ncbi:MAG: NDP-sugar synthase [Acidobacteriota bacterium]